METYERYRLIFRTTTSKKCRENAIESWKVWLAYGETTYVRVAARWIATANYLESIGR